MGRVTKLVNAILGIGTQRRSSVSPLKRRDVKTWEVRPKPHHDLRRGQRTSER